MLYTHKKKILALSFLIFLLGFSISCNPDDPVDPVSLVTTDAGNDQTVNLGEDVTLIGSATSSTGGALIYVWEMATTPTGSLLGGFTAVTQQATFTPDVEGVYIITLTVTNESAISSSDDINITVNPGSAAVEIGGTIDTDTRLENLFSDESLPDYIASSNVFVSANLIIDPGVKIVFTEDTGLEVSSAGSINAVGTNAEPIVLTGTTTIAGFWKGISIQSNNASNELSYVTVEYGGSSGFDGANLKANVMVEGAGKVKITNSIFQNSGGYGIYTRSLESSLEGFANNTITANEAPIMTRINHYHYFDAASTYTGNTKDYIDSYWSNNNTTQDVVWNALDVPFRMASNIENIESAITIMPGANFIGQPNGGIEIIASGSLKAVATTSAPIIFKGEQDLPGYWRGLVFSSNNANNELNYVTISNGGEEGFDGANLKSNVMVEGVGRLIVKNTTLKNSGGYGIYTRSLDSKLIDFTNNTITENVAPVMTRINHYHFFDNGTTYTGNTKDYIDSYWSNNNTTQDVVWNALDVPFRMASNIEDIESAITIMPGANFIGQPNGGIRIIDGGSLKAIGTASARVTFIGEQDVEGYWRGLRFLSNTLDNELVFVTVSNGGEVGFDGGNRKANIEVGSAGRLNLSSSTLSKSGQYGVGVQSGGVLIETGNTFTGNLDVDIFNY